MVDFNLSEEQRRWQRVAAEYARDILGPVVREVERRPDPLDRMPWPQIEEASALGLRTLTMPRDWGGVAADWLTICLVAEEIAAVDIGTATTFEICWMYAPLLFGLMRPAQRERFLRPFVEDPTFLLAPMMTEPDVGSDNLLPYNRVDGGMRTLARREGDDWVINGRKHFTSSGGCSKLYLLFARDALDQPPLESTTLFVVTPDLPGFTIVGAHEKSAHRLSPQTEEVFDDLRVSDEYRVGSVGRLFVEARSYLAPTLALAGAGFVGTGRGAFELALQFARERTRGGRPLIQHQGIAMLLADMQVRLEAARYVVWNAAWRFDQGDYSDLGLGSRAKVIGAEASVEIARKATEIYGSLGIMTDYEVERYLRDSIANLHDFGANQVHWLRAATGLGYEPA